MKIFTASILSILVLSQTSCGYEPVVDTKGLNAAQYQQDLAECRSLSDQANDNTLTNTLIGAGVGAALGALTGDSRNAVGSAAGIGAIAGGGSGQLSKSEERKQILVNCLYNRGYDVLNAGRMFR